jgi:hypothetical protein
MNDAIRYEQDEDGTYVVVVEPGAEVTRQFEVAAWYQRIVLDGGRYPMRNWSSFEIASLPGHVVETHTPSLFGGVMTGGGDFQKPVDEPTTYSLQVYTFMVRDAIVGHSLIERGRYCGCVEHVETTYASATYENARMEREGAR